MRFEFKHDSTLQESLNYIWNVIGKFKIMSIDRSGDTVIIEAEAYTERVIDD